MREQYCKTHGNRNFPGGNAEQSNGSGTNPQHAQPASGATNSHGKRISSILRLVSWNEPICTSWILPNWSGFHNAAPIKPAKSFFPNRIPELSLLPTEFWQLSGLIFQREYKFHSLLSNIFFLDFAPFPNTRRSSRFILNLESYLDSHSPRPNLGIRNVRFIIPCITLSFYSCHSTLPSFSLFQTNLAFWWGHSSKPAEPRPNLIFKL